MRSAIIEVLTEEEADDLAARASLSTSAGSAYDRLQKYFKSYSEQKARQFVTGLSLPSEYIKVPEEDDRTAELLIDVEYGEKLQSKGYLHSYQKIIKDEIAQTVEQEVSRHVMVQMPTGAGKTYTALETFVDTLRGPDQEKFYVWIVDSNELAEQALDTFTHLWKLKGDRPVRAYRFFNSLGTENNTATNGVVFASFATAHSILSDPGHRCRRAFENIINRCGVIVVDEAHTSTADTYRDVLFKFRQTAGIKLVGLTATPGRNVQAQNSDLTQLYGNRLVSLRDRSGNMISDPVGYLQENRYLAELNIIDWETNIEMDVQGMSDDRVCEALAKNPIRNQAILQQIEQAVQADEATLVFACTLDHVYALKILCNSRELKTEIIVGATSGGNRQDILSRFRNDEVKVLINLDILSTGVDLPNVDKIIITRPVGSPILYSQIMGRALRGPNNGGNETNTVVTLKDNIQNFGSANNLFTHFWESWGY